MEVSNTTLKCFLDIMINQRKKYKHIITLKLKAIEAKTIQKSVENSRAARIETPPTPYLVSKSKVNIIRKKSSVDKR